MFERATAAASLIVRHASAYADLIAEDVGLAHAAFLRRLLVGVVLMTAGVFSIAMACVWVIALTWDTPGRIWLIVGLFALFMVIALVSLVVLKSLQNSPHGLLTRTRLEWQKDRVLLDDLLARPAADGNRSS